MVTTWGQFKAEVEKQGITDKMEISYIDISYPIMIDDRPDIVVKIDNYSSFAIEDGD